MRPRIAQFSLAGFKTIRQLTDFIPGNLTILIGPNGAGKSNFISFFRLLSWALNPPGQLQTYVELQGGASAILHAGRPPANRIVAKIAIKAAKGTNEYGFELAQAAQDKLIYTDDWFRFLPEGQAGNTSNLGVGHKESQLIARAEAGRKTEAVILAMLRRIIVHQFHNTSSSARIRNNWDLSDGRWLKEDAGNLGSFLYRLQSDEPIYYRRIVETTRLILPFFADYEFVPDAGSKILLRWRELESDRLFDASQAADGMLRVMALVALLQQPERDLPDVLIMDEPELGLHPYAIGVLSQLISSASKYVQVIVATQSISLIDTFDAKDIVVVNREGSGSTYARLKSEELSDWLKDYSLSELWEKNILGGRPRPWSGSMHS